tara:strand:- start:682 stop:1062 length:381 start_codon:yes stop_codon:yes gene_type:complete
MAEKEFPEIKEKNQGKFTAWAKKNGFKDACSAASAVMKSKKKYSSNVVKMANYANNFGCSTAKSPAKQTDKKIKKMEEKTKRIGIRQGEKTRRVEARNNPKKTKKTLENVFTQPIDINDPRFLIKK